MTGRALIETAWRGEPIERVAFAIYTGFFNSPQGAPLQEIPDLLPLDIRRCWTVERESVTVETRSTPDGGELTLYHTPLGDLCERRVSEGGYGSMWTVEHLVKSPEDWRLLQYLIEDTHYLPNHQAWEQADEEMGDRGLVMCSVERMPFQQLWIQFGDIEQVCIALAEDRDLVDRMVSLLTRKSAEMWPIMAQSRAEFVWLPDNLTSDVLGPELFRRYAEPYLEALAAALKPAGKKLVCHIDGHMAVLADLIGRSPVDVVESFTPPPAGNLPLGEALRAWPDKCLCAGPPPSWHLLEPAEIKRRMLELVQEAPERRRFSFEISENVPWDVAAVSIRAMAEALAEA